jgi:peptidoglycan/LPS O-acetylase OafA/YrhL
MLPLALVLCLRLKRSDKSFRWIPIVFIAIAIICLGLRVYRASDNYESTLFPTHLRIDSLFAGVVISYFYHYYPGNFAKAARRYRWWLLPLGVICFIPTFVFQLELTPFIYTYELSVLWLGGGLVLFSLINGTLQAKWPIRLLSFVGSRSYSIYLWHMPLAWALGFQKAHYIRGFNWYSYATLFLTGSVLLGIFMASVIEYPLLHLRDRLFPSRSQPLNPAPLAGQIRKEPPQVGERV